MVDLCAPLVSKEEDIKREAIRAGAYLHPSSKIELLLASKIRSPMREAMPIRALLNDDQSFSPEEAKVLVEAFEQSLKALRLVDREDPATLLVAEKVLEAARGGERDMQRLRTWVLAQFGASPP